MSGTDYEAMGEAIGRFIGTTIVIVLVVIGIVALIRHNAKVSRGGGSGASAAPNWYPDPEHPDQLRYWDGTQWTEHRSPRPPS